MGWGARCIRDLAVGGEITADHRLRFASDYTDEDRSLAVVNILKASAGEASMMARCTGKTDIHNLEPEDLRAITLATAEATDIPLAGTTAAPGGTQGVSPRLFNAGDAPAAPDRD